MQKKIIKTWVLLGSTLLCGLLAFTAISCGDDDDEPAPVPAVADFTYVITGGSVVFTNTSTNGQEFSWDFGDGSASSTEQSPTHLYEESGTYTVELTALGDAGTTASVKEKDVVITIAPEWGENLLVGGTFETADQASWTKLQGNTAEPEPTFQFGATEGLPTGSTGGGFRLVNDAAASKNVIFYQELTLEAATYKFSGLIKIGARMPNVPDGTANPSQGLYHFWFETYVGATKPTSGDGYNKDPDMIAGFNGWNGTGNPAVNGDFPAGAYGFGSPAVPKADVNGEFTIATAGTYYFVFKSGYCCNGGYGDGIAIDNWQLRKKN